MATIGTLAVNVVANTGPLNTGLGKASQGLQRFQQTAGGGLGMIATKLAGVAAAALSVHAAIGQLSASMQRIDATAKLADRVNTSTEALQGLRHAAGLMGVGTNEFDSSLEKMLKKLGEARLGSDTAAEAFWRLGLPIEQLANMDSAEVFTQIADRIAALPTAAERAAAATQIFEEAGQKLLNTLNQGGGAIRDMIAENERLGNTFSRLDASKVEAANDAIARMKTSFAGLVDTLAIHFAPVIEWIAGAIVKVINVTREWYQMWANLFFLGKLSSTAHLEGLPKIAKATQDNTAATRQLAAAEREAAAARKLNEDVMKRGASVISEMRLPQQVYNDTLADLRGLLAHGAIDYGTYQRAVAKARAELENTTGITEAAKRHDEAMKKLAERGKSIAESVRTPLQEAQADVAELNELVRGGFISWEVYHKAVAKVRSELVMATKAARENQMASRGPGGALRRGSTAAVSAAESSRRELRDFVQGQRSQTAELQKQTGLLGDIRNNLGQPPKLELKVASI